VDLPAEIEALQGGFGMKKSSSQLKYPRKYSKTRVYINLLLSVLCKTNQTALPG
jgi:hypothetical protein